MFAGGNFQKTFERFPLAVICIAGFYVLGLFDLPLPHGWGWVIILLSYCGVFWLVSIKLYAEAHGLSRRVSTAISLASFLPIAYLALVSHVISSDALGYSFPALFALMFVAPFLRRNVKFKEIGQFYSQFWGHIGRTIPIVFLLFMIALAVFFWLYPVFGVPRHRSAFSPLSEIIICLLFPMMALMGVPKVQRKSIAGCVNKDRAMQITVSSIDNILIQEGIEGFIEAGAPADEYQVEAAQIAAAISLLAEEEFREENILAIISLVWIKSFELSEGDVALRLPALRRVTQAIHGLRSS